MVRQSRLSLLVFCLAGAVSACTPRVNTTGTQTTNDPAPASAQVAPAEPVVVALLAPSTAPNANAAEIGRALVNAAQMAAGELGDPLVDLRVYDTAGDATQARAAADRAIGEGARVILGPLFSSSTKAVSGPAQAAGLKVLSFSTDSTAAGDPVYLTGFLPEVAAARVTSFARARGYDAIGVFYPGNLYGAAAFSGAQAGVPGAIVTSLEYERSRQGIPAGAQAFAAQAGTAGAKAVLIADSGQALSFAAALLQNGGLSPQRVKYLGLGEWNSRVTFGESALRGGWFAAPDPAAVRAFVEKYQVRHGSVPPLQAVLAYDAVKMAGTLIAEARGRRTDPFSTQSLTRPAGFTGAVGPIRLGADGIGRRGMAILEVGEGVFTTIDAAPATVGAGS